MNRGSAIPGGVNPRSSQGTMQNAVFLVIVSGFLSAKWIRQALWLAYTKVSDGSSHTAACASIRHVARGVEEAVRNAALSRQLTSLKRPGFCSSVFEEDWVMAQHYSQEFKARAVRLIEYTPAAHVGLALFAVSQWVLSNSTRRSPAGFGDRGTERW